MVGPVADRVRQVRESGLSVMTLERGFSVDLSARAPWQLLGAKTLSYATNMAALRYAANLGADDVIFVSSEGQCVGGTTLDGGDRSGQDFDHTASRTGPF